MSTVLLTAPPRPAVLGSSQNRLDASSRRLTATLAAICVGAYFVRATLLPTLAGPRFEGFFTQSQLAALLAAATFVLLGGVGRVDWRCALLVGATACSLWN